jgi:hypothetical protein
MGSASFAEFRIVQEKFRYISAGMIFARERTKPCTTLFLRNYWI